MSRVQWQVGKRLVLEQKRKIPKRHLMKFSHDTDSQVGNQCWVERLNNHRMVSNEIWCRYPQIFMLPSEWVYYLWRSIKFISNTLWPSCYPQLNICMLALWACNNATFRHRLISPRCSWNNVINVFPGPSLKLTNHVFVMLLLCYWRTRTTHVGEVIFSNTCLTLWKSVLTQALFA